MDYTNIFSIYNTAEGVPFYFLSKKINFPSDKSLPIYEYLYCDDDYPWTIVSYKLYGTIDYWWVLSALNDDMPFYAKAGETILIIKPNLLEETLKYA